MLNVHSHSSIFTPGASAGNDEAGDAVRVAILAGGAGEHHHVRGDMHARRPHLLAIEQPSRRAVPRVRHGAAFHEGGVRSVIGFGQAEGGAHFPAGHACAIAGILFGCGEGPEHDDERIVADDGVFVLKIVMQAKAFGGKVFADDGHGQMAAAAAAIFFGPGKAVMPGGVGRFHRLRQQCLPLRARQAVIVPIGARMLAPMIEEARIVIARLQRRDDGLD